LTRKGQVVDFIKSELEILLGDLVEEDGTLKRSSDLKSGDAGVAWSKVAFPPPLVAVWSLKLFRFTRSTRPFPKKNWLV
jgi:hypothetical protein